jgi:hypothetical protein
VHRSGFAGRLDDENAAGSGCAILGPDRAQVDTADVMILEESDLGTKRCLPGTKLMLFELKRWRQWGAFAEMRTRATLEHRIRHRFGGVVTEAAVVGADDGTKLTAESRAGITEPCCGSEPVIQAR